MFVGGPVAPESVVALGEFDDPDEAGTRSVGSLGTLDPDGANDVASAPARVCGLRRLVAPASSTPSSSEDAWIVEPADAEDPFPTGDIWSDALRRKGGALPPLATMPADPSLN